MKELKDFINEGNISNVERKYREFCQFCTGLGLDVKNICVKKTSKGNYAIFHEEKRKGTVSSNILDDEVIELYGINTCE